MTSYRLHGLVVSSPLPLGRQPVAGPADVEIRLAAPSPVPNEPPPGEPLVSFSLADVPVYSAGSEGGVTRFRVHGLCEFEMDGDQSIALCRPGPNADLGQVALVARGAFLAFWLGLQETCVLHASAVEHEGRTIVFAGRSGMGKSTLAGWSCAAGARFVCDDLLRLDGSTPPGWRGRSPELRLRPSAEALLCGKRAGWRVGPSADGRLAALPPVADEPGSPVGAVVVPFPDKASSSLQIERLDPVEAVLWLVRFPRLEGWRLRRAVEAQLDGVARLAHSVPVYRIRIPWGPPFPNATAEELLRRTLDQAAATIASG